MLDMRNKKLIILFSIFMSITLLVLVTGVLFSVRYIEAYCYLDYDSEFDNEVIEASGIKKGSGIFFLDEKQIIENIELKIHNVDVVNIERIFPNRICINYIKYQDCFTYIYDGSYYECDFAGVINQISDSRNNNNFLLKLSKTPNVIAGEYFLPDTTIEYMTIDQMLYTFSRCGYKNSQVTQFIDFVDLRRDGYLYIRTKTGAAIEILSPELNLFEKLHFGLSTYSANDYNKVSGTIIISAGGSSINNNPVDDYYQLHYSNIP